MSPLTRRLWRELLDLLAPRRCAACDALLEETEAFCAGCAAACAPSLVTHIGSTITVQAASLYAGPVRQAVRALKYGGRADLGEPLGRWAAARLLPSVRKPGVVIPVALHPTRTVERGYNQATLVARGLLDGTGLGLASTALRRVRRTEQQARLTAAARSRNVEGAFELGRRISGPVWVLDDVVTTGATARACVEALRAGGANVQGVLCLAVAKGEQDLA